MLYHIISIRRDDDIFYYYYYCSSYNNNMCMHSMTSPLLTRNDATHSTRTKRKLATRLHRCLPLENTGPS